MAVYRFSASIVKRSGGRSATAAAAYRAAECIEDERTGLAHDYRRRGGVEYAEILAPENAPDWMRDRAQLWNTAERLEKRKDAQLAREIQLSLPHELENWQRVELVRAFIREQFVAKGMVADIAIHAPDREGDNRNHHAHVMLTMRDLLGEGFGKKQRAWNETAQLEQWRDAWAQYQNRALERAGKKERVDHRSLEAQGLDREPEPKLGPHASEMEKRGKASDRGDERREVQARNRQREALRKEAEIVDLAIERETRKQARAARESEQEQYRGAAGKKEGVGERKAEAVWSRERAEAERIERDGRAGIAAEEARRQAAAARAKVLDPQAKPLNVSRRAFEEQKEAEALDPAAFAAWAEKKRRNLAQVQGERRAAMQRRHEREGRDLKRQLGRAYGDKLAEDRAALRETEERLARGGLIYRLISAGRDRERAEALRANIGNAKARWREQESILDRRHADEAESLVHAQQDAGERLEKRLAVLERRSRTRAGHTPANDREKPRNLKEQIERDRARERERERGPHRSRERDREM